MSSRLPALNANLWRRLREPTGQVSEAHGLGRWISLLSSLDSVRSIVEIGTWKGNGTTKCIAKGLTERSTSDARAWCLEADREMAQMAYRRWRRDRRMAIIWGRIVDVSDFDMADLQGPEVEWAAADARRIREAPLVLDQMPPTIDLLILDGGEFTTHAEFTALKHRVTGWLVLDDTRTRKCRLIADSILSDPTQGFFPVWQSDERNGVLVARRLAPPDRT